MVETKLNNIRMLLLQNSAETLMERVQIATLFDFFSEKELSIGTTNQILDLNGFARLYREDLIYDIRVITSDRVLPQLANLVGGSSGYVTQYTGQTVDGASQFTRINSRVFLSAVGNASQLLSTLENLKVISNAIGVVNSLTMDHKAFDLWYAKLEAMFVARLKRFGRRF